jgi:hypothetical protein
MGLHSSGKRDAQGFWRKGRRDRYDVIFHLGRKQSAHPTIRIEHGGRKYFVEEAFCNGWLFQRHVIPHVPFWASQPLWLPTIENIHRFSVFNRLAFLNVKLGIVLVYSLSFYLSLSVFPAVLFFLGVPRLRYSDPVTSICKQSSQRKVVWRNMYTATCIKGIMMSQGSLNILCWPSFLPEFLFVLRIEFPAGPIFDSALLEIHQAFITRRTLNFRFEKFPTNCFLIMKDHRLEFEEFGQRLLSFLIYDDFVDVGILVIK